MSVEELQVLRKFLRDNLDKGFIRASTSPAASPVLFAKKPGGGLRFCVDYRALNAITIKNRYPLPLLQETLSKLSTAKFYTKLDVIHAFNRIRMKEGQEWMTAFNTRYGLFETLVMPFGLSNAPATFQARINEVLRPFLDIFCTAYIDDILVFSDNLKDHRKHVRSVLKALQEAGLQLDIRKCKFETTEVTYLGMIVSTSGIKMDPSKVQCILDWQAPTTVKDVQGFLGFSNFYRRFIKGFSRIVRPLVHLTKKDIKWGWNIACQKAFDTLKNAFTSAPTLRHFDPSRQIFVETDASDWVSSGILSQKDNKGELHPVAFMSRKFDPAECNYEIYDKELLAIVRSFESWRAELQGVDLPIIVLTDHRNLEYFMTTKQLTRRQVRWSEFLSQFDYICSWRPGKLSAKPDALTRRPQDLPSSPTDPRTLFQQQALLKPDNLDPKIKDELHHSQLNPAFPDLDFDRDLLLAPLSTEPEPEPLDHKITRLLDEGYKADKWWLAIRDEMLKPEGIPHSKQISLSECQIRDNRLFFRNRLYVPDNELRLLLTQTSHNSAETGHPGKNRLYECLSRDWFWPKLSADTRTFIRNCHGCKRNETSRLRYQGTLKPLPLPI
jgi:RNase H-like domain found in reverse transcriptase/Reverse transcriptase (RNA-dependent DNA polymerase)/Integrase zinc binding domain